MGSKLQQGIPGLDIITMEMAESTQQANVSHKVSSIRLFPYRNGMAEEAYFDSTFLPLPDVNGNIGGLYNSILEVTKQRIIERRAAMFNYMANPSAVNSGTLASHVMPQLEQNPLDITMALLYEVDEDSMSGVKTLNLRGNIGVPQNHSLLVEKARFKEPEGLIPLFSEHDNEITTHLVNGRFDNIEWRGFGRSKYFSILPISGQGRLFGFLVIGVNPHRPIDEDHRLFMWDLSSKISAVATSVSSASEWRRRSQLLEGELRDSATQIQYMAKHASVGLAHTGLDKRLIWANEQYYQLVGRSREGMDYPSSFLDIVLDEDRSKAEAAWDNVVNNLANDSVELRLKNTFVTPSGGRQHACVLVLKFPHIEDGKIESVMACMTDISRQKWAESVESKKAADAQAAKKEQEDFIDIVSHEMRNPLSAIFQCTDMIQSSIAECEEKEHSPEAVQESLKISAENSAVISLCAQHQKRIVDDVLTLSKMEHMMLLISPRPTQPLAIIQGALRMFEADYH
jgi:PAS domain-containing protein